MTSCHERVFFNSVIQEPVFLTCPHKINLTLAKHVPTALSWS